MPKNWNTYKLGDIAKIKYGKDHKKLEEGTIPCYGTGGIMRYVNSFLSDEESVLIPRKGSLNSIFYINRPFWTVDTLFWTKVNNDIAFAKYLYYYLTTIDFASKDVGSAIPSLTTSLLNVLDITLPPLPEQKAIASILSALDDKIENNLAMNKTLEDMAMELYKHWFVDFGPFQEGKFVDSELGKIPEGWEVKRLDEVAIKKSESFNFKIVDEVVFVNTGDVQEGRFLHSEKKSKTGLPGQAKKAISKGDILYSEIRPKNKRYAFVNFDSSDYVVSTKFMIINPKENILNKLLYRVLTMQSTVDNFNSIAEGRSGTFPQITFDAISDFELILPPLEIQRHYQKLVSPMEMKQDELYTENQTLTNLRDTLLPKLISGEVRLKEFKEEITAAL
ncbi:restriction endonuclease subunit S [Zobellia uliginosa]|uniref:restriction endonuclease subunit S n=1 Tax=Zobellia uliginosa TaxID=143224 RepID=UPI001C07086D|nr:restriction endonuclease subunit S [Zobellia uliginosa]MBU2945802.1 restriction endonuclease subunit S [Zobellia uliginosa]